ncbi:MAG: hypothetical protein MR324_00690 [Lachnospiraceae bacterium]|nr:hypothetical protein [Lachnospiraceae bacterium]
MLLKIQLCFLSSSVEDHKSVSVVVWIMELPLVVKSEPFCNTVKRKLARFSEIDKNEQTEESKKEEMSEPKENEVLDYSFGV